MKRVLVIAAHPDDEVLGMGGTIAKLVKSGCVVDVMIVTDGSSSQYRDSDHLAEIIEAKKKETRYCADILGVSDIYYGELPDMKLDAIPHIRINQAIEDVIEKVQPDTVFTHFWGDVNCDHQYVYKSTLVAVRPLIGQVVKDLYCYRVPSSTEWAPNKADTMFMPNYFVDIEKFAELKYKAFACYSTELRKYPHPRSVQYLKENDKVIGLRVGMLAAEEFIMLRKLV
jgi:LmbE family N-acetylglucosaminyl deacetylase